MKEGYILTIEAWKGKEEYIFTASEKSAAVAFFDTVKAYFKPKVNYYQGIKTLDFMALDKVVFHDFGQDVVGEDRFDVLDVIEYIEGEELLNNDFLFCL